MTSSKNRGLSIRLTLVSAFSIILLLVVGFVVASIHVQFQTVEPAAVLEATHVAKAIASSTYGHMFDNPVALQQFIAEAHKLHNRDVFIVDATKRVIADADPKEVGRIFSGDPDNVINATINDGETRTFVEGNEHPRRASQQVVVPLWRIQSDPTGPIIGALVLEYTSIQDELTARARLSMTSLAAVGIAFVVATIFLGIRVVRSISRPLADLERGVRALAAGDYGASVPVTSANEIGALATAFNRMAHDLSAGHASLIGQQLELEERVAARTGALRQSNDELLQINQKLEATETRARQLATIVDQSRDAIITKDLDNVVLTWNRGAEYLFGCTAAEAVGRPVWEIANPETSVERRAIVLEKIRNRRTETAEYPRRIRDGRVITVETSYSPLLDESGSHVGEIAIIRDISERKRAEQALRQSNEELKQINQKLHEAQNQLLQSEKMASIGQLAAGVAHEINNPIGYVNSNLGSLENYLKELFAVLDAYQQAEASIDDAGTRSRIAAVRQSADLAFLKEDVFALMSESSEGIARVKKIVQDLKDFSHAGAEDEWRWTDLHHGLNSTLNIVNNEIKYKAKVVKQYGDLPQIECLPSQLNQVFMNMLVNAAHAIEAQGTITIRTGAHEGTVWVEIGDTGQGIAPEHIKRVFDPFFTTKPVGKGTGLGLSLSYGIVQKHRGRIEVQSEPGKGATFRVCLPVQRIGAVATVEAAPA